MIFSFIKGCFGLACLVTILVLFFSNNETRLILAKFWLVLFMFTGGLLALIVVLCAQALKKELAKTEIDLKEMKNSLIVEAAIARAQLSDLRQRLYLEQPPQKEIIKTILQYAPSVIALIIKNRNNWLKWGVSGFKLANSFFSYLRSKK